MVKCIEPRQSWLDLLSMQRSKMRRNLLGHGQNAIWDVSTTYRNTLSRTCAYIFPLSNVPDFQKGSKRKPSPAAHTHNDCPWKPLSWWLTPGTNSGGCVCSPGPLGTTTSCPPPSYKGCLVVNDDGGPQRRIMAARWSYSSSNPPLACYNVNIKGRNKSHT